MRHTYRLAAAVAPRVTPDSVLDGTTGVVRDTMPTGDSPVSQPQDTLGPGVPDTTGY